MCWRHQIKIRTKNWICAVFIYNDGFQCFEGHFWTACELLPTGLFETCFIPALTRVFELLADDVVDEERLPDDFDLLHSLHRLGDQQQVSEQDAVHVHLRRINPLWMSLCLMWNVSCGCKDNISLYPGVFALLHPQRSL